MFSGFEQAFQSSLVLGGQKGDDRARLDLIRKELQRLRDTAEEAAIGVAQGKAQRFRDFESGVGTARVVERPLAEILHEISRELGKRGAFGARQHDHHRCPVGQAIIE